MSEDSKPPRPFADRALEQLCQLLEESGATVTFSMHCRSGVIGDLCRCWRCRGLECSPGEDDPDEQLAARDAEIARRAELFQARLIPRATEALARQSRKLGEREERLNKRERALDARERAVGKSQDPLVPICDDDQGTGTLR